MLKLGDKIIFKIDEKRYVLPGLANELTGTEYTNWIFHSGEEAEVVKKYEFRNIDGCVTVYNIKFADGCVIEGVAPINFDDLIDDEPKKTAIQENHKENYGRKAVVLDWEKEKREKAIKMLVRSDLECLKDSDKDLIQYIREGFKGYENMTDNELYQCLDDYDMVEQFEDPENVI